MAVRTFSAAAFAVLLAAGCGGSGEECTPGCPAGETCFGGVCVPEFDALDGTDDSTPDAPDDRGADDRAIDDASPRDDGAPDDGAPDDGGPEDVAVDDGAADDGGCVPTGAERCNGVDDDCNGRTDEGFPCQAGTAVACTTTCGSPGSGSCRADCSPPSGSECTPPAETCNGRDDDCDAVCDDGFACCAGRTTTCTTACGSRGTFACSATCGPSDCTPPAETCNGADDDCDGECDEGSACCAGTDAPCTTTCGSTGTRFCTDACTLEGECFPPDETCGNGDDDDCDGFTDEGCPENDDCDSAQTIASGTTVTGSTALAVDDYPATCGRDGGGDVVFTFTLTETSDVFLDTAGSVFDTVLYAGRTCGASDLGCSDDVDPGRIRWSTLTLRDLAAGTYYVVLDAYTGTEAGDYSLTMYATPADSSADRCGDPTRIVPGSGGTARVTGNLCELSDEYAGTCGGDYGSEAVYWFWVGGTRTVTFASCNAATTVDTVLYLRSGCDSSAAEVGCNDDGLAICVSNEGASRLSASLSPGLYYLFVDMIPSFDGDCGPFQVDVSGL